MTSGHHRARAVRGPLVLATIAVNVLLGTMPLALPLGTPAQPDIVQQFLTRDEPRLTSFRAVRHLEARNDRYKKHGWLHVLTSMDAEHGFRFEVLAEGGSSYVREKVLKPALMREVEASQNGESARAMLNDLNYEFAQAEPLEGLVRVGLIPRRRDLLLVKGAVFLHPDDGDLVRIEGELAKTPSFWTRKVHVVRRYGRIGGYRVPVAVESTAQVVMAGPSTFSMTYIYEELNGEPVVGR